MRENLDLLDNAVFRKRFRGWIEQNVGQQFRRPADRLRGDELRAFQRLLHADGWRAPAWPREHGGMGLSVDKQLIYHEELDRWQVARTLDIGMTMVGPTLMHHGTTEQKGRFLPRILACEDLWCQGYSEPNSGSDLASLRTSATSDGDDLIVTGQKIWTTHASEATYSVVLVRTNNDPVRQRGITFLIIDLRSPGVTIRPIVNLAGEDEFCEVFYDSVRVPKENVVGMIGEGWSIAKSLLGPERLSIGSPQLPGLCIEAFERAARELGIEAAPRIKAQLATMRLELHAITCLYQQAGRAMTAGKRIDNELSILKIAASELFQRATEALIEAAGEYGAIGSMDTGEGFIDIRQLYMVARPATIYGGTNEIQRNILAKQFLRMPAK